MVNMLLEVVHHTTSEELKAMIEPETGIMSICTVKGVNVRLVCAPLALPF